MPRLFLCLRVLGLASSPQPTPLTCDLDARITSELLTTPWLDTLWAEQGASARTLAALRSFYRYCLRRGLIREDPVALIENPKSPKRACGSCKGTTIRQKGGSDRTI